MYNTNFTVYDKEEYNKMKISAMNLGLCMRKFLWKAAVDYKNSNSARNTLLRYLDVKKHTPKDIFNMWEWNKYIRDKNDLKKVRVLIDKLNDLCLQKERDFD